MLLEKESNAGAEESCNETSVNNRHTKIPFNNNCSPQPTLHTHHDQDEPILRPLKEGWDAVGDVKAHGKLLIEFNDISTQQVYGKESWSTTRKLVCFPPRHTKTLKPTKLYTEQPLAYFSFLNSFTL
jgi:hypothetical protein